MKVKSVSELAFKALDELTDDEDELWIAHTVFNCEASSTGEIQKIMKRDCGVPYYVVQAALKRLVDKDIIQRVRMGVYAPNLMMLLPKMLELLSVDDSEKKINNQK